MRRITKSGTYEIMFSQEFENDPAVQLFGECEVDDDGKVVTDTIDLLLREEDQIAAAFNVTDNEIKELIGKMQDYLANKNPKYKARVERIRQLLKELPTRKATVAEMASVLVRSREEFYTEYEDGILILHWHGKSYFESQMPLSINLKEWVKEERNKWAEQLAADWRTKETKS